MVLLQAVLCVWKGSISFSVSLIGFYQISKLRLCSQSEVKCRRNFHHRALKNFCYSKVNKCLHLLCFQNAPLQWCGKIGQAMLQQAGFSSSIEIRHKSPAMVLLRCVVPLSNKGSTRANSFCEQARKETSNYQNHVSFLHVAGFLSTKLVTELQRGPHQSSVYVYFLYRYQQYRQTSTANYYVPRAWVPLGPVSSKGTD